MFKITITETKVVEQDIGHKWEPSCKDEPNGKTYYAYTDSHMAPKEVTVERYQQCVDELDIAAVIAVVNGLLLSKEVP